MDNDHFLAWGDESIRMSLPTPSYLLAASYSNTGKAVDTTKLEKIKPKRAAKLHWMDMNSRLKQESVQAISHMKLTHTVVIAAPLVGIKQERARRKCLESLLPNLETRGIDLLVLESRGEVNDKRDIELLLSLRRKKAIQKIDITHRKGSSDPALWVPDQLLGAYAEIELKHQSTTPALADDWQKVRTAISEIRIQL